MRDRCTYYIVSGGPMIKIWKTHHMTKIHEYRKGFLCQKRQMFNSAVCGTRITLVTEHRGTSESAAHIYACRTSHLNTLASSARPAENPSTGFFFRSESAIHNEGTFDGVSWTNETRI